MNKYYILIESINLQRDQVQFNLMYLKIDYFSNFKIIFFFNLISNLKNFH